MRVGWRGRGGKGGVGHMMNGVLMFLGVMMGMIMVVVVAVVMGVISDCLLD